MSSFRQRLQASYDTAMQAESLRRGLPVKHISTLRVQILASVAGVAAEQTFAPDRMLAFGLFVERQLDAYPEVNAFVVILRGNISDQVIATWEVSRTDQGFALPGPEPAATVMWW